MKKIKSLFLFALMTTATLSQAANWKELAKGPAGRFYYDVNSISGEPNARSLAIKLNLEAEQKDGTLSRFSEYNIDCKNNSYILKNSINYDLFDLEGRGKINQINS